MIVDGQDFRATLAGQVTDSTNAAISGAMVKATNVETGETKEAQTTSEGSYTIPYLNPGVYNIEVTATGFRTLQREKIVLRVADKLNLPLQLQVGAITESVTVTAQQEVVETGSADRGLVFDPIKTQEYPLNGRQTYMLMSLTPGVLFTQEGFGPSGFSGTRGWDVNNKYKINGAREGQNVFLLNGAPISDNNGNWELAPNVEAVQEFKVMTNTYDAQYGRFGGGVVNTTVKSGANDWHGSVFDYFRNRVFDANYFQNKLIGKPLQAHNQHQFGGVVGGPVRKDKDFVFGSFEGWREIIGFSAVSSVPPLGLRTINTAKGGIDFGALGYKIYDPMTARLCGSRPDEPCTTARYWRDPFPNNVLPANRINPIALKILSYFPAPNTSDPNLLSNNFVASGNVGRYYYNQPMFRWDHIFSENDKFYALATFQHGQEYRDSKGFGPPAGSGDVGSQRTDQNYIMAWTHVLSPRAVLDLRGSYGRFTSDFPRYTDFGLTADKLGIPQAFHAPTFPKNTVPRINFPNTYSELFACCDNVETWNTYNQWNLSPSLTMTSGRHTRHFGFEYNYVAFGDNGYGYSNGTFDFGQEWTRRNSAQTNGQFDGASLATLLLGTPTGGFVDWNESSYRTRPYVGMFAQDDWRISPRVTLNLGLRYEVQVPWLERFNRVNRGFDTTTKNPYSDAVLAKWATNRADLTACAQGDAAKCNALGVSSANAAKYPYPAPPAMLVGGYLFPGTSGQPRRIYNTDWTTIAPRAGIAWRILDKTILRAGAGIYYQSPTQNGTRTGFTQRTGYTTTNINDDRFPAACGSDPVTCATGAYSLASPFPQGIIKPTESSLGLATNVGNGAGYDDPNFRIPRTYQYSFGFQQELPHAILVEASYAGNYQIHINNSFNSGYVTLAEIQKGVADNTYLNIRMPNPFFGVIPGVSGIGTSSTITRVNLLRPDPIFPDITNNLVQDGHYRSDALQVKLEKRVLGGATSGILTWGVSYTFSKAYEQNHRLNNWNAAEPLIYELDNTDKPHTFAFHGVWDLPFGKGRRFFTNSVSSAIIGDWRFDWIFTYTSGYPVGWPNLVNNCGDWHAAKQDEDHWFNSDKSCYATLKSFTPRTLPDRFPDIRNPSAPQLNVALEKTFNFSERYRLQFRAEAFNVTNTPIRPGPGTTFTNSDFGKLPKQQQNFPRVLQLAGKIYF